MTEIVTDEIYAARGEVLTKIARVRDRLYSEYSMSADDTRDLADTLRLALDEFVAIESPYDEFEKR